MITGPNWCADDWRLAERRHVGRGSRRVRPKRLLENRISAVSPAIRVSFKTPIRTRCFPSCGVPSPGFTPGALNHAADAAEKERMAREADFAFRQAWALCPYSPEAVFRYVNFLLEQKRIADALLVAETAAQMPAMQGKDGEQIRGLVEQLKKFQKAKPASSGKVTAAASDKRSCGRVGGLAGQFWKPAGA